MIRRGVIGSILLAGLALNSWNGFARIAAFIPRHRAEQAIAHAELDLAYTSLLDSLRWQTGDNYTYILIGRAIQLSQTNAVPIATLASLGIDETFALGSGALAAAISRNPADPLGWFSLAEAHGALEQRRQHIESLKAAVEAAGAEEAGEAKEPPAPAARGADRITVAAVLKALELEPQFFFYHDFLARLYWEQGLMDRASEEIRTSFAMIPDVPAHPWMENRDMTRALAEPILAGIEDAAADTSIDPVIAARSRADVLERLERFPEAIEALGRLREAGGEQVAAECDMRIGRLMQRQGDYAGSVPYLERATQEDPQSTGGISALSALGNAYARAGEHDKSVAAYRDYIRKKPGSLSVFLSLAAELEALGKITDAEQIYVAMVKRFPEAELPYKKLIEHLRRQRRFDEANRYADELSKIRP